MIALAVAAVAAHVVMFPSGFYGWITFVNSKGSTKSTTTGVKRTAAEAASENAAEGVAFEAKVRAKKRPALANTNNTQSQYHEEIDADFNQFDSRGSIDTKPLKKTQVSKQREQEVVLQMRSEREREHIKLLCDLAANRDLGLEVTDAAKQLVLEFLKKPLDEDIDLEALRQSIPA
jgi:hypothetical protein